MAATGWSIGAGQPGYMPVLARSWEGGKANLTVNASCPRYYYMVYEEADYEPGSPGYVLYMY